jgi:hypothetical protein
MFFAVAVLIVIGMMGSCGETMDNFNSQIACQDYCNKKYACENHDPTGDETSSCVSSCRNSIENNCGNQNQAAANDKIGGCVDKSCVEFWACMVFDAAPGCFGFVGQ